MADSNKGPKPFDTDIKHNHGYRYTTAAPLSAQTANERLTQITVEWLRSLPKAKSVMDLGCGDGIYTAKLAAAFPRRTVRGCDPAGDAIKLAKKQFPHLELAVSDLLKPKTLPKHKVDASVVRGVIHHVPDAPTGLATAVQFAPHTLIIEPNGWNPIVKIIERFSSYHRAHGERSFTSSILGRWTTDAGARVTKVSYIGLVPFFCPKWLVKPLKSIEPFIEKSFLAPLVCAQAILQIEKR
jgi:SAM-dependent methyltransferase